MTGDVIQKGAKAAGNIVGRDLTTNNLTVSQQTTIVLGTLPAPPAPPQGLRAYLEQLAESYQWLELQGIREAGTLRIELEKVYVALKAEPESEYDRQQAANLHTIEIQE